MYVFFFDLEVIALLAREGIGHSVPEEKQALWAACEESTTVRAPQYVCIL